MKLSTVVNCIILITILMWHSVALGICGVKIWWYSNLAQWCITICRFFSFALMGIICPKIWWSPNWLKFNIVSQFFFIHFSEGKFDLKICCSANSPKLGIEVHFHLLITILTFFSILFFYVFWQFLFLNTMFSKLTQI